MKTASVLGGALLTTMAFAQPANDVRAGKDFNFDLVGLNYTYSGFSSGSGTVLDPQAPPTCVAKNQGTLNFTMNASNLGLPFNVTIPMVGSILNPERILWTTDSNPNVTVPITVGGQTIDFLIRRVWGRLTNDLSAVNVFRDLVCNQGYNVRLVDTNSNTDSWLNVEAYAFGIQTAFFRVDFLARDIRNVSFGGVPRGQVSPSSFSLVEGLHLGGNLTSLAASDNDHFIILCDETTPNAVLEVVSTSPGETPSSLTIKVESSSSNSSLTQFIDAFNYTTNAFANVASSTLTATDVVKSFTINGPATNHIQAGTCQIKARIRTIPFADLEAADGWTVNVDQFVWDSLP
jgi:hypothetical protein